MLCWIVWRFLATPPFDIRIHKTGFIFMANNCKRNNFKFPSRKTESPFTYRENNVFINWMSSKARVWYTCSWSVRWGIGYHVDRFQVYAHPVHPVQIIKTRCARCQDSSVDLLYPLQRSILQVCKIIQCSCSFIIFFG